LQCLGSVFGDTRPFDKNSDKNSDGTVMEQWCLQFEHFYIIVKVLRCHWSYSILKQCLGSVVIDLVTEQWCNSDGTVMPLIWEL
jgi:hypothetical protein